MMKSVLLQEKFSTLIVSIKWMNNVECDSKSEGTKKVILDLESDGFNAPRVMDIAIQAMYECPWFAF
ncbi:hypothetical protein Trydic_g1507 [Trypoxylus dichotomus]